MLKIRCFAPALQVALNDQPISLTEQPALLLAYLVAHDGPASRADIARLFWPQSPEKNQSEQLRNALRSLKIGVYPAQLETYVQTQPPGFLTIDPAHVDADTRALTRTAANPRASLDRNDGHGFFQALGDSVITGPTLTNVNDFRAIVIDAPAA
jgi:DNA-binding SARP family transcriptional activator